MAFLNPLVLLGLAAAAIPVVVHLFNMRRPQRVDFSSLVFVKALERRTMRRMRIRQWLLLALRVLAIACLVLAFARPVLRSGAGEAGGAPSVASRVIVLDNSLSMTLRDGQGAYLDQAKALANTLLAEMTPADELFVLTTAGDTLAATPYSTPAAAREAVQAVEAGPGAATLAQTAMRASRLLEDAAHPARAVYLISDLQRSTLGDTLAAEIAGDVRVRLLPTGSRPHANVAVTDVQVQSRIVDTGQPVRLQATLENFGTDALEDYVASVYLEGERTAQAAADLEPGQSTTVAFTATPQQRGWLAGRVQIEGDDFPADDTRYFTLHVPEERQLLLVRGAGQSPRYVELALSPELTEGRLAFETTTIEEAALPGTPLAAYDAVALVGPRTLSSGERVALARYVETGGGLLLFPGTGMQIADYNALLEALGGGRFEGYSGVLGGTQPVATFARVDLEHPLFEGVFDPVRGEVRPERPEVYYAANYAARTGAEQTLIEMTNGRPFLQEIRHGRGRAFVAAVAPAPAWSDLPTRGLFLPLLYRSFFYLSAGGSVNGAQLTAGQPEALRLPGVQAGERLRLVGPEGGTWIPEQRRLFGAVRVEAGGALHTPGVYDLYAGEELVQRLAVNLAARESNPATYEAEAAAEHLAGALGVPVRAWETREGAASVQATLAGGPAEREIWNVFLLAALALLVAEMIIARYRQPEPVAA